MRKQQLSHVSLANTQCLVCLLAISPIFALLTKSSMSMTVCVCVYVRDKRIQIGSSICYVNSCSNVDIITTAVAIDCQAEHQITSMHGFSLSHFLVYIPSLSLSLCSFFSQSKCMETMYMLNYFNTEKLVKHETLLLKTTEKLPARSSGIPSQFL